MARGKPFQKRQRIVSHEDNPTPCDRCYTSLPPGEEVHGRCVNCRSTHGDLTKEERKESEQRFKQALHNGRPVVN